MAKSKKNSNDASPHDAVTHVIKTHGWFVHSAINALTGLVLGLITSVVVIVLSHEVFPAVAEFGTDQGLRLKVALNRMEDFSTRLPAQKNDVGFVFLDVDPEVHSAEQAATSACDSLKDALYPKDGSVPAARDVGALVTPTEPACSSSRPLNRYLLAHLVKALSQRGAKAIILDVTLAGKDEVIEKEETDYLIETLKQNPASSPVIYAAPVELVWREGVSDTDSASTVIAESSGGYPGDINDKTAQSFSSIGKAPNAVAAVAFTSADSVARRYPRCFQIDGTADLVMSLPYRAASFIPYPNASEQGKDKDERAALGRTRGCTSSDQRGSRIIYTLPHISDHEDGGSEDRAQWAFYREVYNRCLAANFWNKDSGCGIDDSSLSVYSGKIVVIGASNPVRRDWHYTPIGNMVGAEVVINATRSALQYGSIPEGTWRDAICHEAPIVLVCAFVWFLFHAIRIFTAHKAQVRQMAAATKVNYAFLKVRRGLFVASLFSFWLLAVMSIAVALSFNDSTTPPSLNVLIAVLAISLEQYVEAMKSVLELMHRKLATLFGIDY